MKIIILIIIGKDYHIPSPPSTPTYKLYHPSSTAIEAMRKYMDSLTRRISPKE